MYAYPDNHRRFALLGWMACELAKGWIATGDRSWCTLTTGTPA